MANLFGNATFSGGVPRAMLSRAAWLVRQGHQVDIYFQNLGPSLAPFEVSGVKVWPVPGGPLCRRGAAKNRYWLNATLIRRRLAKHHERAPFGVVDLHDGGLFQAFRKVRNLPKAFTIHSSAMLNPEPRPARIKQYNTRNELLTAAGVDLLLPVSHYVFSSFVERGHGAKGRVVYNCVPEDVRPNAERPQGRPLTLMFAARYAHNKGFDTVLEALETIATPEGFHIKAFGEGPYADEYRKQVRRSGLDAVVSIGGNISDRSKLLDEYATADAFLLPTRYEAFSVALLEAYGLGLPAVTTTIPPNLELSSPTRLMFEPGNASGLARVLNSMLEEADLLAHERRRALEVAEQFRADRVFPSLLAAYRELHT